MPAPRDHVPSGRANPAVVTTAVPGQNRDVRDELLRTIDVIRPALQADGGDIVVKEVDEETGVVTVELVGACGTCPASTVTMKAGIERILRDRVEGVTEVIAV
ncbi:MAG: NifU family protein [Actinobacteria bacterium]|nr:NifU family protein [Actinomycetota bacterium]MBW3642538.1 NifU family protein [Actinomycetota bacterium]